MTSQKPSKRTPAPLPVAARFFTSATSFRRWLERHHGRAAEIWVGFHRKHTGRRGLTYADALDVALCFGWIDGVRKKLDETTYTNRFTPRRPGSIWSTVNIRHVERLTAAGQMHDAGLTAYARRDPAKSGIYSFEQRPQQFPPPLEARFREQPEAWAHFSAQPPGYRRLAIWFVISAKREETQLRRLRQLMTASAAGGRLGALFGQTGPASTPAGTSGRRRSR